MTTVEIVPQDTIDAFYRLTKYDVEVFITDFVNFMDEFYADIYNYFAGLSEEGNAEAFDELDRLSKESGKVIEIFKVNAGNFNTYDSWTLLELIEDIKSELLKVSVLDRWLRSPNTNDLFGNKMELDYVSGQGETLEFIQKNVGSSSTSQNDWVDLALRNKLREEDYTPDGGYLLKITFKGRDSVFLHSVVDNINSTEKAYGLDLDRVITFENEDLKILTPRKTIEQAADILLGLKRGDNPFHENDGVDPKVLVGNSLAGISYPTVLRQLSNTFSKDDTFAALSVIDITKEQDGVYFEFEIETTAGDLLTKGILVS